MTSTRRLSDLMVAARQGHLTRRDVLKRAAALGLSAPAIAALLAACGGGGGGDESEPTSAAVPSGAATSTSSGSGATPTAATGGGTPASTGPAGGAGEVRLLWWQAPTILNSHLSSGTKDFDASRIALEPLADWDDDANLVPLLSDDEVPSLENGMVAKDGLSVTWKLRKGVKWHDGQPFTAKDVVFTYQYITNPDVATTTSGSYQSVKSVEAVDDYTVKITFKEPEPAWFRPFTGSNGYILPEHVLKDFNGPNARNAPFNLKPVGTGPFKVVDFKPGDVGTWEINQDYWAPGKPHFDKVTMKGGGDATSAARAVFQTGEADYAWNLQIEPEVIKSLEAGGQGKLVIIERSSGTERIEINHSDPLTEENGERSYYKVPHPHFKVKEVRQALALAIQRDAIAKTLYGPGGQATATTMNTNPKYLPDDLTWEYDLDKAKQLLDQAGAKPGGDGIRELNGRRMHWVYSSSVNSVRQKTQEIVKNSLQELGIEVELKSVDASVFFSGDPGNPDTLNRAQYDLGMWTNAAFLYPNLWYRRYLSANPETDIAQKSNQWAADNVIRYQNEEFNRLFAQVATELDPDKQTELFKQMQRLVVTDVAEIGIVARNGVAAISKSITGQAPSRWASDIWNLRDWGRQA